MAEAAPSRPPLYTIGHARHGLADFVHLLQGVDVTRLVDVRSFPRSRANPQFNVDTLPAVLQPHGISYRHMPALGGRRPRQRDIPPECNALWNNQSFHNYADYSQQPAFATALQQLVAESRQQRTAFMCSETVWWRCHRRIITDWLLARGETVWHILPDRIDRAVLTHGAVVDGSRVTYPALNGELRSAGPDKQPMD